MISRLSACAAIFAVAATVVLSLAAAGSRVGVEASGKANPVVQLETIVVIGKRAPAGP
jgi:hypothetical protein